MVDTQETITLKEVIEAMDKGLVFSIGFWTCNHQKKTGGEFIELQGCHKHNYKTKEQVMNEKRQGNNRTIYRNPNHFANSTRNIVKESGELVCVHLRLIRKFNQKRVL